MRLDDVDRFWAKVSVGSADACWEWTGERNNQGYGRFVTYSGKDRQRHLAHRTALRLMGVHLDGLIVMHSCDNPPCVNPFHLSVGTQLDNMRDALAKGRMNMDGLVLGWRRGAA